MKINYENGEIKFHLHDVLQNVSAESKADIVESLACDDDLIKHVVAQILDRWTENCYSGGSCVTAPADPTTGLDWARRQIAKRSSEVVKSEIEKLESALALAKKENWELITQLSILNRTRL